MGQTRKRREPSPAFGATSPASGRGAQSADSAQSIQRNTGLLQRSGMGLLRKHELTSSGVVATDGRGIAVMTAINEKLREETTCSIDATCSKERALPLLRPH